MKATNPTPQHLSRWFNDKPALVLAPGFEVGELMRFPEMTGTHVLTLDDLVSAPHPPQWKSMVVRWEDVAGVPGAVCTLKKWAATPRILGIRLVVACRSVLDVRCLRLNASAVLASPKLTTAFSYPHNDMLCLDMDTGQYHVVVSEAAD